MKFPGKKIFSPNHFMPYRNQKYHLCKLLSPYYPESFFTIINVIKLLLYPFFLKMMFIRIEIDDISRKNFFPLTISCPVETKSRNKLHKTIEQMLLLMNACRKKTKFNRGMVNDLVPKDGTYHSVQK